MEWGREQGRSSRVSTQPGRQLAVPARGWPAHVAAPERHADHSPRLLADELAAWSVIRRESPDVQQSYAWDMAMMGLRIGKNPQAMIATTPRPIPILRELVRSPNCVVTRALAETFFSHIIAKYEGTRLGRQELLGDILEGAEGALWTRAMVEAARDGKHSTYARIVVAIDPAVSANPTSALTGIVVAARGHEPCGEWAMRLEVCSVS
jgi:phage terminase large subunit-like protein